MGLVQRTHESGLVVAEESADEAALGHALKQIDRAYVLQKNPDGDTPGLYVVACVVNEDEPPIRILAWADGNGEPLPLSSGLVEEVKKWRPEARTRRGPDADAHNQQLRERTDQLRRDQLRSISDDHRPFVERNRVGVALAARSRRRYWQKNRRPPQSGGGSR